MFALFALIAVVSATEYVVMPEGPMEALVYELDKCMNLKEEGIEVSRQYKKKDEKTIQKCTYSESDCKTEIACVPTLVDEFGKITSELPKYVMKEVEDPLSETCENVDNTYAYYLYLDGCNKAGDGIYGKYDIENNKLTVKAYTDEECKTEYKPETPEQEGDGENSVSMECDQCKKQTIGSVKYICGSASMTILALLMIFVILF